MYSKYFLCAIAALAVVSGNGLALAAEQVEESTESPVADMALIESDVKSTTERPPVAAVPAMITSEAPAEGNGTEHKAVEQSAQPHTVADFIIHPLIAFKPRQPEDAADALGKQATTSSSTPAPSGWQLFGFNAGQGLGSSVSSLAGSVTGWFNDRIQLPGLVDTPVRESTTASPLTTTSTTLRPDVVVRVQHKGSTRRPLIQINNNNNRNRPQRPNKNQNNNNRLDSDEEDDEEFENDDDFRRGDRFDEEFDDERYDEDEEGDDDNSAAEEYEDEHSNENDDNVEEDDEAEEQVVQRPNNRRRPVQRQQKPQKQQQNQQRRRHQQQQQQQQPIRNQQRRRPNGNQQRQQQAVQGNRRRQVQQQRPFDSIEEDDEADDNEAQHDDVFYYGQQSASASKRSQNQPNFIQRGQQTLINQIRQFTRGQTPAEIGNKVRQTQQSAAVSASASHQYRPQQATLLVNRNGQTVYVAPELLNLSPLPATVLTPSYQYYPQTVTKQRVPASAYPQPPLSMPVKRKGRPTQYITIPWSQLGLTPPDQQLVSIAEGIQSQPLILSIPQSSIAAMQSTQPQRKKKRPTITAEAVPLLADASLMDIFKPPRIPPSRTTTVNAKPAQSATPVLIAAKPMVPARIRPGTIVEKAPALESAEKQSAESDEQAPAVGTMSGNSNEMRHSESNEYIIVGDESESAAQLPQVQPAYGDARYVSLGDYNPYYDLVQRRYGLRKSGRALEQPDNVEVSPAGEYTIPVQVVQDATPPPQAESNDQQAAGAVAVQQATPVAMVTPAVQESLPQQPEAVAVEQPSPTPAAAA